MSLPWINRLACALLTGAVLSGCAGGPGRTVDESAAPVLTDLELRYQGALEDMSEARYDAARQSLEQIIMQAPTLAGPYVNLAILHARDGQLEQAEKHLLRAIELNGDHAAAHNELGVVYRRMGRFLSAEQSYARALAIAPDYAKAHYNLGVLYDIYLRRTAEAVAHYERYQALSTEQDDTVKRWVADLQRRLSREQRTAQVSEE